MNCLIGILEDDALFEIGKDGIRLSQDVMGYPAIPLCSDSRRGNPRMSSKSLCQSETMHLENTEFFQVKGTLPKHWMGMTGGQKIG